MRVDKLLELREKIGSEPVMPDSLSRLSALEDLENIATNKLAQATDPNYSRQFRNTPLEEGGQPNLSAQAQNVAKEGRMGDSMLMHVSPSEVRGLASLRPVTENPETGLPEAILPLAAIPATALAGSIAVPAAAGTAAAIGGSTLAAGLGAGAMGWAPSTIAGSTLNLGTAFGSAFPMHGAAASSSFLGGLANFTSGLWDAYSGMNPILQGALKGAFTSPAMNLITGEPTDAEDVFAGAVVGATLGGVEKGISNIVPNVGDSVRPSSQITTEATPTLTERVFRETTEKVAEDPSIFSTFLSKAKDVATDPLAIGLTGLTLASAFSEPDQGEVAAVPKIEPFSFKDPKRLRTPITVDPDTGEERFTEESIIDRVVSGQGDDAGLGRQIEEVANGGLISLQTGGGIHSSRYGNIPSPGSIEHYQRYGTWGGPEPGSAGYHGRYGTFGVLGSDPQKNPHLQDPMYGLIKQGGGGGGEPVPEVEPTPFQTRATDFNVQEALNRITGDTSAPVVNVPVNEGTSVPIDDPALEDLLTRFRGRGSDPIISLVSDTVTSNAGGLISLANGGEPTAQNVPVFEGQVPMSGDGMDDDVSFKVLPQTVEDAPDTPDMALLSSDEYVLPADVVSMLGNGSSNAGAATLDRFTKLIRKKAHGTSKQQTELNENKELAALL